MRLELWDGTVVTADANGQASAVDGTGAPCTATFSTVTHETRIYDATGAYVSINLSGDLYWMQVCAPDGHVLEAREANGRVTRFRSGLEIHFDATGLVESISAGSVQASHEADGTWKLLFGDGSTSVFDAQGSLLGQTWWMAALPPSTGPVALPPWSPARAR